MSKCAQISVIIPVYNSEKYLDTCIESVVDQTYSDLQIILVDDGSSDQSGKMCDIWKERDSRIHVIHQENAGVTAARNAGLNAAKGEIIAFIDSDDVLSRNAYDCLIRHMNTADLVIGKMRRIDGDGLPIEECGVRQFLRYSHQEFLFELIEEKQEFYLGYLCDKLYRRDIIENNAIRFHKGICVNEDRLFLMEYLLKCSSVAFCDLVIYDYRQHSASVIGGTRSSNTVTDREMTVIDSFLEMARLSKGHSEKLYHLVIKKSFVCSLDLRRRVASKDKNKKKRICQFMRSNARVLLRAPDLGIVEKIKIAGHCILQR